MAEQEQIVDRLHNELKQIRMHEDDAIRRVLSPAQLAKFEEYLKLRKEMVGSPNRSIRSVAMLEGDVCPS